MRNFLSQAAKTLDYKKKKIPHMDFRLSKCYYIYISDAFKSVQHMDLIVCAGREFSNSFRIEHVKKLKVIAWFCKISLF